MSSSFWAAEAPANIALIKYMGKVASDTPNTPSNSSLSYTLENLRTRVELTLTEGQDSWEPLRKADWMFPSLSEQGQRRFIKHFQFLKNTWGVEESFKISSASNFPSDCGLASSASSFAALTLCTYKMAAELKGVELSTEALADLSRQGSGSSCRSFFSPWAEWNQSGLFQPELPQEKLLHLHLMLEDEKKAVSSSEAHQRVLTSPKFSGRIERAEGRLKQLKEALQTGQWKEAYRVSCDEFEDMHELFETSTPSFKYMNEASYKVVNYFKKAWEKNGDGPIVTLDAGPNIHLLFRPDQTELYETIKNDTYMSFLNEL